MKTFQDHPVGPELRPISPGVFFIGSPASEVDREADEGPRRRVHIARSFAIGCAPVTFDQWDAFAANVERPYRPSDMEWGRGDRPVINVSWHDARRYLAWLSRLTGHTYRLPSEAEWEYAARAGGDAAYWWGEAADPDRANFNLKTRPDLKTADRAMRRTTPVGAYPPNPWGLSDMLGNVGEWCADAWIGDYRNGPDDGRPRLDGCIDRRVVRGGGWDLPGAYQRAARRSYLAPNIRTNSVSLRVVRELDAEDAAQAMIG